MDLKIVCLLFGCLLSIALAQGEEEAEDGGSQGNEGEEEAGDGGSQEKGTSEECKCDRRRGGRGRGGRGPGERGPRGWGRRGGKDGEKKCFVFTSMFRDCDEMTEKLCDYVHANKEDMKKCWKMDTPDDKRGCMEEFMIAARKSFGDLEFPKCMNAMSNMIAPQQ